MIKLPDDFVGFAIKEIKDLKLEARERMTKELMELDCYMGVNLLNVRPGFSRNRRFQQLCKLIFGS